MTNQSQLPVKAQSAQEQIEALRTTGFIVQKTNKGGASRLCPVSRVEYRKANKLTNAAAKRQYAAEWSKFSAAAKADFAFHSETMGVASVTVTSSGVRKYALKEQDTVVVKSEPTREEALKALGLTEEQIKAIAPAPEAPKA